MTDSYSGLRILVVEDSPGDQFLVTEMLRSSVLKIQLLRIADTLAKAKDFLGREYFDIILLDLTLPDSSGIDTFKNIKQPAGKTPVIILSGATDANMAVEAIIHGAQDYYIKGEVDEKLLARAILYSIERKRNTGDIPEHADPYIAAKMAKLDLVQSEEITKQIMHGALDGIVCIDVTGKITVWNPQAEKIFGWKGEEILGKSLTETIIPIEHRSKHIGGIQHYLATGEGPMLNKLIEVTALNRDGALFPIELTVIPLIENANRFFCAFIRDISERKKAEETIHLSHQRLKNAELIGKTGYWHWDVRTGKVTWSEGTYNVFGEVQGNFKENFDDFIARVVPGDRENIRQIIQRVYESKQSASYEFWIETPLGDNRYISTTAEVILDNNGEVASMFGTTNDDTVRKLAREKEKKDIGHKQVLAKLNEAVSRAKVPEEIYELALNALQEAIRSDKASILLFDENGKMRFVASRNLSDKYKKAAEGHSPWTPEEKNAKPILITHVEKEPSLEDLLPAIREEGICALGFVPLVHQQNLLGKFMVYFTEAHSFDEDEVRVIQNIAANVAFAISEKKSAVALKESEEKHRALFENSLDGILMVIPEDGTILTANPAACRILQMTEEEICRAGREGIVNKDDIRFSSYLKQRQQTGKVSAELSLVRKDGSKFPVEISSALFKDAAGKEKASILFRDITERKKNEEALKKSELYIRSILHSTNDGILAIDNTGKVITANNRFAELWRIPPDLLTKNDDNALLGFVLDQLADPEAFLAKVRGLYKSDQTSFDTLHFKDDRVFERLSTPLILDQQILGRVWSFRDITAQAKAEATLKESERRVRQVLACSADNFYVIDRDLNITMINQTAEKDLQRAWGKPVKMGTNLLDVLPADASERIKNNFKKVFNGEKVEYELHQFIGGVPEWVFVSYIPVVDNDTVVGAYIVSKDITERKLAEESMRRSERQLLASIENTPNVAVQWYNRKGEVLFWNRASENIFGWKPEEAVGKTLDQLIHTPEAAAEFVALLQYIEQTGETHGPAEYEFTRKDGSHGYCVSTTFAIPSMGNEPRFVCMDVDITQRKLAEQKLKSSEERYRSLVEQASDGILVTDLRGNIIDLNERLCSMFGYSMEEAMNKNVTDFLYPDNIKEQPLRYNQLQGDQSLLLERVAVHKDGTIFDIELNTKLIGEGKALSVIRNVSERKRAELMIKESEERYRTLVEHASDPILIYSLDGKIVDYNNAFMTALGYEKKDLENLKLIDLLFEEDLKDNPLGFGKIKKGISVHDERRAKRKDGSAIPVELNSKMMPDGNVMVIARDVTERKRAEEEILRTNARFEVLSRATSDIIWDWDILNDAVWWNDNYYALLGIKKEKEFTSIDQWYKRIHPDDLDRVRKEVDKARSDNSVLRSHEYRYAKEDGTYLHFLDRSFVMRSPDGQPYRMIGSMVDMTPIYIAQQEVAESETRLRTIYETEPECIKLLGKNGVLLEMNPAGLAMIEADDLAMVKGKPVLGIIATPFKKAFEKLTRDVFKGISGTLEFEIIGLKGTHRWLETHAVPMRDVKGSITALLGVTRDISERKKAEKALIENEEKYRTLVEQAVDAIALYDATGRILDVNTGSVKLLGYSKKELTQMFLADVLTKEEIKKKPVRYDVLQKGESTVKQRMMRRKDGSVVQTEVRSQQLPDGRFLSVIRDLTERVTAQEQIKKEKELSDSIINSLPGLFYLIDESGRYIRWNKLKEEISGYTAEEISRMSLFDFFDGGEKELVRSRLKDGFAKGTTEVEAHLVTKSGKKIFFYFTGIAIDYEGRRCLMGTGIDISDRKKAEMELEESYSAIRKLTEHLQNIREEERTHIAREIHDELGQKLTVLKMDISWINKKVNIKEDAVKTRMKELLAMLDETVKAVRRISSDLRPSLLDDLGLTAAMEWQLHEFEKRFNIKTSFKSPDFGTTLPEAMKTGLFRIFQESLTNVARHSRAKKVTVTLNRENGSVILTVMDDGVGFDKQNATNKKTLGILGMKERTSMIGGSYEIISKPGKGTQIVVTVPFSN